MGAITVVAIVALFIAVVSLLFNVMSVLAIGALARDLEAFKAGVRGMAGAADRAFDDDRKRLYNIEKFLIFTFKLDDLLGTGSKGLAETDDPSLQAQVSKKSDLKN